MSNLFKLLLAMALSLSSLSANAEYNLSVLGGNSYYANINNSNQAAGYSYQDAYPQAILLNNSNTSPLGTLGGNSSYGYGINDSGQVAGYSNTSNGDTHATVWSGTNTIDLGAGYGYAINSSGQVAGNASYNGNTRATLWSNGTSNDLGTLGGTSSFAYAINSSGQVAGESYLTGTYSHHAVLWSNGNITDLGQNGSSAWGINDAGQVVGGANVNSSYHAILWTNGVASDLGTLNGDNVSTAYGINSTGQIVGNSYSTGGSPNQHGVIWYNGTVTDLNTLLSASYKNDGWVVTDAKAINDNGSILAYASNSLMGISGQVLLTSVAAVPELNTNVMLLMGAGVMGFIVRRRKQAAA
ncbi:MAG: DUF3466 family protein [Methylophilaceae bacterium]|nr:MAG: DUF3466 family protein [Methylophilaceae bacterium]